MAEDFDVEAMLEAPFREKNKIDRDRIKRSTEREETGDGRKDKKRHGGRSRSRERESRRDKRSDSRQDEKSSSKKHKRSSSRSRERDRERRGRDRDRRSSRSPVRFNDRRREGRRHSSRSRSPRRDMGPEERDQRTVFCMQLAARVTSRELEEFFSAVGKVREVRLIMDNKTRKHKGIAYIEYYDINSVPLALALNGQKLLGVPILIQPTQAEKNRAASSNAAAKIPTTGPMRLYVGSLHFNITEDMLRGIFEPFGKIDSIHLMRDAESQRSKGFGFITFCDAEDAKKALEQLNGFELAGRPMRVSHVTDRSGDSAAAAAAYHHQHHHHHPGSSHLESDETDRGGIDLGSTGRLQLMAKLAEGTGIRLPPAAMTALQHMGQVAVPNTSLNIIHHPPATVVATQCFMLNNMFDPHEENNEDDWDEEIKNDVIEECRKHGGVWHVYVDKHNSSGNVYVKCPSIAVAAACVSALHGRWFSGRMVTATYVPLVTYNSMFPASATSTIHL